MKDEKLFSALLVGVFFKYLFSYGIPLFLVVLLARYRYEFLNRLWFLLSLGFLLMAAFCAAFSRKKYDILINEEYIEGPRENFGPEVQDLVRRSRISLKDISFDSDVRPAPLNKITGSYTVTDPHGKNIILYGLCLGSNQIRAILNILKRACSRD